MLCQERVRQRERRRSAARRVDARTPSALRAVHSTHRSRSGRRAIHPRASLGGRRSADLPCASKRASARPDATPSELALTATAGCLRLAGCRARANGAKSRPCICKPRSSARQAQRRAALLIRWSAPCARFWSRLRAAVRSRVPQRRQSGSVCGEEAERLIGARRPGARRGALTSAQVRPVRSRVVDRGVHRSRT
jgi:hypothetical protein